MRNSLTIDKKIEKAVVSGNENMKKDPVYISLLKADQNFKMMIKEGLISPRESQAKSITDTHLMSFTFNK